MTMRTRAAALLLTRARTLLGLALFVVDTLPPSIGHSQTAEAASFRRALFTPGANSSVGTRTLHARAAGGTIRLRSDT